MTERRGSISRRLQNISILRWCWKAVLPWTAGKPGLPREPGRPVLLHMEPAAARRQTPDPSQDAGEVRGRPSCTPGAARLVQTQPSCLKNAIFAFVQTLKRPFLEDSFPLI